MICAQILCQNQSEWSKKVYGLGVESSAHFMAFHSQEFLILTNTGLVRSYESTAKDLCKYLLEKFILEIDNVLGIWFLSSRIRILYLLILFL